MIIVSNILYADGTTVITKSPCLVLCVAICCIKKQILFDMNMKVNFLDRPSKLKTANFPCQMCQLSNATLSLVENPVINKVLENIPNNIYSSGVQIVRYLRIISQVISDLRHKDF